MCRLLNRRHFFSLCISILLHDSFQEIGSNSKNRSNLPDSKVGNRVIAIITVIKQFRKRLLKLTQQNGNKIRSNVYSDFMTQKCEIIGETKELKLHF